MSRNEHETALARVKYLIEWEHYPEALSELEKILSVNPENPDILSLIAEVYLYLKQYDKALKWTDMALNQDPMHLQAWRIRVHVFCETDKIKKFQEAVRTAMHINPLEPSYHFLEENVLIFKGGKRRFKRQKSISFMPCVSVLNILLV